MILPIGKLDSDLLEEIVFKNISYRRSEVIQRPGIGEDCAVVDFGEYDCVLSTDPITASVDAIGKLSINITLNDIASNGVQPIGIMLAVMLPAGTTDEDVEKIMKQAGEEAAYHGIEIIGGHTEITDAVNRPVIVSTALGRCRSGGGVNSDNIKEGDRILVSKELGLEGVGIIAADREEKLKSFLSDEEIALAKSFVKKTSVLKEGIIAGRIGVDGMHDITEGGLLGAVWEMCKASGLGAEIYYDRIPRSQVTEKICNRLGIDFLRLISSGSMLIIAPKDKAELLIREAKKEEIEMTDIGEITASGAFMVKDEERIQITPPKSDELYKALQ